MQPYHALTFQSYLPLFILFVFIFTSMSPNISAAKSRPVIPEPEIHGSHSLDNVTGFLLLMSEGLINALESAHGPEQANQVSKVSHVSFFS